ncbi:lipoprotein [Streptosporangium violaceochromogenes]|nr:lipoprotein [Streptosporangium violaceochromogenes]
MALTGRAALLALLGTLVVLTAPAPAPAVAGVALLIAAVVAVDLLLAGSVRPLRLHRAGDRLVRLGETATVELIVENPGPRRVRGVLRDAWPPSAGARPRHQPLDVPPGERRRLVTTLTPSRRGDREAVTVTVRALGPLGVAARQGSHRVPWSVRVLPPFLSRRHLPAKLTRLRELEGRHPSMVRGQGTEFDSLREYVVGDDVRSIDWRATARRHDVVVRTWRPERDRRVLIVLDTGRTSAGRVGTAPIPLAGARPRGGGVPGAPEGTATVPGWPRLDWSMDAALLLAALATRAGDRVDFLAHDRSVRAWVSGAGRGEPLSTLVNTMAPIEAELVEADSAGMVAAILARAGRRCLVVVLTDLNSASLEEGLLPVLPRLSSRHLVLLAAVSDPQVTAMAAGRGTSELVYNAAAAERQSAERRRITARLRGHGVEVVDAAPEQLASALADAYLALKAEGRL